MKEAKRGAVKLGRMQTLIAHPSGKILAVNAGRMYEAPFFLLTNPPNNNVSVSSGAGSSAIAMRAAAEGPMQIVELGAVRNSTHKACKVQLILQDGNGSRDLMNNPCHIDTIFGPGGRMYPLPEALYLDEGRALTAVFSDLSAAVVTFKARSVGVATITTQEPHGLLAGDSVAIVLNPADATFDTASVVIATVPSSTTFTYVNAGADVAATATGGTAAGVPTANQARIAAPAAKYSKLQFDPGLQRIKQRMQAKEYLSSPYFYTLDSGPETLTGLQSVSRQITISSEFNFDIHQITVLSSGRFSLDIIDLTKGESIIQAPSNSHYLVPDRILCGDNQYPFKLAMPWMVFSGQRLEVQLQDTSGGANTIWLVLGGSAMRVNKWD